MNVIKRIASQAESKKGAERVVPPTLKDCSFVFDFRIQRFGGFVTWNSVGQANVNGRLAMTRSIGDFHLKNSGVIAEPDTKRVTVSRATASFDL